MNEGHTFIIGLYCRSFKHKNGAAQEGGGLRGAVVISGCDTQGKESIVAMTLFKQLSFYRKISPRLTFRQICRQF